MNIADIMTKEVITVSKETPLKEAAGLLAKFRIHGFPVVDSLNRVEGIVTESDFFTKDSSNIYLPTFLEFIREENKGAFEKTGSEEAENMTKVGDIMSTECVTVQPDTPIEKAIQLFKDKGFNSMPVTDKNGILVGIVTIMDIIKLL